jgi:hypothetical protein
LLTETEEAMRPQHPCACHPALLFSQHGDLVIATEGRRRKPRGVGAASVLGIEFVHNRRGRFVVLGALLLAQSCFKSNESSLTNPRDEEQATAAVARARAFAAPEGDWQRQEGWQAFQATFEGYFSSDRVISRKVAATEDVNQYLRDNSGSAKAIVKSIFVSCQEHACNPVWLRIGVFLCAEHKELIDPASAQAVAESKHTPSDLRLPLLYALARVTVEPAPRFLLEEFGRMPDPRSRAGVLRQLRYWTPGREMTLLNGLLARLDVEGSAAERIETEFLRRLFHSPKMCQLVQDYGPTKGRDHTCRYFCAGLGPAAGEASTACSSQRPMSADLRLVPQFSPDLDGEQWPETAAPLHP